MLTLRDLSVAIVVVAAIASTVLLSALAPWGFAQPMYEGSKHCAKHPGEVRCAPPQQPLT